MGLGLTLSGGFRTRDPQVKLEVLLSPAGSGRIQHSYFAFLVVRVLTSAGSIYEVSPFRPNSFRSMA